jgi:O-antigen biosynthesis protein
MKIASLRENLKRVPGLRALVLRVRRKYLRDTAYYHWIRNLEAVPSREHYAEQLSKHSNLPLISIIVPVYNVKIRYLERCVESVLSQYYPRWELCLCDDASTDRAIPPTLEMFAARDKRIRIKFRENNGRISAATNDAFGLATGDYVAFLDDDDELAPHALAEIALAIVENSTLDILYSDVDNISSSGARRMNPHFKPDWSPETLLSYMYLIHLLVMRRSLVVELGGLREGFDGSQDYDLALRATEKTDRIAHIPQVLYHWRLIRSSTTVRGMKAKPYAIDAAVRAKEEALMRRGLKGAVIYDPECQQARVRIEPRSRPLVSIVIATRDHLGEVDRCLSSIDMRSDYRNFEVVLVDNGSADASALAAVSRGYCEGRVRLIRSDTPFNFSYLNNLGASEARGEYLLFLNNDTEVLAGEWLERMLGLAQLDHVGAVGARLLYPDGRVQHAGIVNYAIGPGHPFCGEDPALIRNLRFKTDCDWIAVTGACLMVSRAKYREVGGLDEELAIAYNDVALCFALRDKGYYNAVAHEALLRHYESSSRGLDEEDSARRSRQLAEMELLYRKFPAYRGIDPFYSPNLSRDKSDFSIRNA